MKKKKLIYLLGDILPRGMKMLREHEAKIIREELKDDYVLYSAIEQKDINDKSAQTEESNNNLAERIVAKDTEAIMRANIIIAEPDNNSVGSSVELGQIEVMNRYFKELHYMLSESKDDKECVQMLRDFLSEHPYKEVYCHNGDIRRTDIPEKGDRRSWSINQYLYGVVLKLTNGEGLKTFDWIIDHLKTVSNDYSEKRLYMYLEEEIQNYMYENDCSKVKKERIHIMLDTTLQDLPKYRGLEEEVCENIVKELSKIYS